jgi:3-oxoacyl-[acyl-carrier protein] reductase
MVLFRTVALEYTGSKRISNQEQDMSDLQGKVAIVTGASKGIGASIALGLSAAGARVVVNYDSSRDGAEQVVSRIKQQGGTAVAVQGSVASEADVRRLFDEAEQHYGSVDVLVNNAGVYAFAPIEEVQEAEFHRQFNTNVLGTLLTSREAARRFKGAGSIINLTSVVSENPLPQSSIYSATKGAVDAITQTLAKELGARHIRVNSIAPGPVNTEGLRQAGVAGSDLEKQFIAQTPLGRVGEPNDIAKVAVFLASDASAWITGERIAASGGLN